MRIGVPKEIKNHEYRVGLTPSSVRELTQRRHEILIETNAGEAIGFDNSEYKAAGALIYDSADDVFENAHMIVKVKEPQPEECRQLREGQILFAYLHLAAEPEQAALLIESRAICIAGETVTDDQGGMPLLTPMSEIAGRMSVQVGAHYLEKAQGGRGVLLGGVTGVDPGKVAIIGGGAVGNNAAKIAVGMGAEVTILDRSLERLGQLEAKYAGRVQCVEATVQSIDKYAIASDLVIGAVLIPGASAPKLLTANTIKCMQPGSVVVDVAIDQGGCFETSKPTTHENPVFVVGGVVHYCVTNMPSAVARTSTLALNNATLPFICEIADKGVNQALQENAGLRDGLNVSFGKITHPAVAEALDYPYVEPVQALST